MTPPACSDSPDSQVTSRPDFRTGKKTVVLTEKKGETLDKCATISKDYACCNVHVLKSVSNCPFECSYCFLQNYLNDGTMSVIRDTPALIREVREKMAAQPWRFFRIGTWELGDSLALEKQSGQAAQLIGEFAKLESAVLELKTKSDCVDSILSADHRGRTVVSWSLNPEKIVREQEYKTASLDERIAAMEKVVRAGYLTGFHFDPMIFYEGWQKDYEQLVKRLFAVLPADRVAWISIGSLRFNPEMKKKMELNYPKSDLTRAEMVLGADGKMRYVKPLRVEMYRHIYQAIQRYSRPDNLLYLCMERWDMWDKVLGWHPDSIGHLDYLFAKSLHDRYPGLVPAEPDRELYEKFQ